MILFFYFWKKILALLKNKLCNILITDNEIIGFAKLYILRRPQNFVKSPPIICPVCTASQIIGGDYAKFCDLLRICRLFLAIKYFFKSKIKQHLFGHNRWHGYLYAKRKNENVGRFIAQTYNKEYRFSTSPILYITIWPCLALFLLGKP